MVKSYTDDDVLIIIEKSNIHNTNKQYKKTVKLIKPLLASYNFNDINAKILILDAYLQALIELDLIEDIFNITQELIQLDPHSKNSNNNKYFILAQIIGGKKGIELYLNGINNIDNKDKIIECYLSIVDIYMTDLCFEEDAEQQCDSYLKKALNLNDNNFMVYSYLGSFRISQQSFDNALECFKKSWVLFNENLNKIELDKSKILQYCYNLIKFLMELGDLSLIDSILAYSKQLEDDNIEGLYLEGFYHYLNLKIKLFNINNNLDINYSYTPNQFMENEMNVHILNFKIDLSLVESNNALYELFIDAKIAFSYLLLLVDNLNLQSQELISDDFLEFYEGSKNILISEMNGIIDKDELIKLKNGEFINEAEDIDLENEVLEE
ncbi:uncharacterized protein HGUI_03130 [Hanseniaspora guilliermondii]|uniref:Assembly chaperone of RPL4 n=1 Tax=Hanseniaspora guilliermondii TaxID=56406 RepID=A0A1L0B3H3_9ASCO|nr:uncharacterized protein HGUI_03130 [Hanseniaspora guilliermondii]